MARSFYEVLTEAVKDFSEHGFQSQAQFDFWNAELKKAAEASLKPSWAMEQMLRDALRAIYSKLIEKNGIVKMHPGVAKFTIERLAPRLRADLDRRIMASAQLIKLNRSQAIEQTLQRFAGWSTSIPMGGSDAVDKNEVKTQLRKALSNLPFVERRVLIDQGHKFTASLNETIANDGGAIAAVWHSHWRQAGYNYRVDHKERDGHVYMIRDNWAQKNGLVKVGSSGYVDEITRPGEEIFCRCLIPSTRIFRANNIKAISRRHYDGPILEIITSIGSKSSLMITPNHPILTLRGWVAADQLNIGDDVVEFIQENISSAVGIDNKDNGPPAIADIFSAMTESGYMRTIRNSRMQFHGDGMADGYVDIIFPARRLSIGIFSKSDEKFSFSESYRAALSISSISQMFDCLRLAPNGILSSSDSFFGNFTSGDFVNLCPPLSLTLCDFSTFSRFDSRIDVLMSDDSCIGTGSNINSSFSEPSSDSGIADFELLCQIHGIPAGHIRFTKITEIKRTSFSGHVYNLQTDDEWYSAEGIISHNCNYSYNYNLRDLPADMLTQKGKAELEKVRLQ